MNGMGGQRDLPVMLCQVSGRQQGVPAQPLPCLWEQVCGISLFIINFFPLFLLSHMLLIIVRILRLVDKRGKKPIKLLFRIEGMI